MSDYKMVPMVATEAMLNAGADNSLYVWPEDVQEIYGAMIAAAPPFVVTDEVVHVALDAFYKSNLNDDNSMFDDMRAAIEAVLGGGV